MRKLVGMISAVVLASVAIFDVGKEGKQALGLGSVLLLLTFGLLMWALLGFVGKDKDRQNFGPLVSSALWAHSFFEGALAAIGFSLGLKTGLILSGALVLHLLPECLAIIAALTQAGYSLKYAVRTYSITIVVLFASFGLIHFVLPNFNERLLTGLSTVVGGGLMYVAATLAYRSRQLSS